jgi:cytochrome c5
MNAYKFLPLVIAVALAACGDKQPADAAATSTAIAPVAVPVVVAGAPAASASVAAPAAAAPAAPAAAAAAPAAGKGDLAQGEKVYTATCLACHGSGVLGAPKLADKAAWGPRVAKGMDVLYKNGINGLNMMPPRGGNAALKDEEVKNAIDYIISKSK